jgi:hypothetical protein
MLREFHPRVAACLTNPAACHLLRRSAEYLPGGGGVLIWSHTCTQLSDGHGIGNRTFEEKNDKQHKATD